MNSSHNHEQIQRLFTELGIDLRTVRARKLQRHREAQRLAPAGIGTDNRDKVLTPNARNAWWQMRDAAAQDGVILLLISAFRSYEFQAQLIRNKLAKGMPIAEILTINAPPGYSEHHTGRALDIGTPGCPALEEAFEQTAAFAWLKTHAQQFGFTLSYPRDNADGYIYEPWHWCFSPVRG